MKWSTTIDPEQAAAVADNLFLNAVKKVLKEFNLLGTETIVRDGVVSVGSIVIDYNRRIVYVATPKAKDDPETVRLAQAFEDAVGAVSE